eukprot:TRINITY_DN4144_c0_g1_i2.p1 TRINITY_DN4144_c0_g1~~TRINITY_DN4144_c0_g1_i2.p1  ORF type:complete len:544 (-),score=87.32 TRINITY_DN4144_c0_g1_i2:5-1636(-)
MKKNYRITCPNGRVEANGWIRAIKGVMEERKKQENNKKKPKKIIETIHFEGYLQKKGKRRYFILHNSNLFWYMKSPQEHTGGRILGILNLFGATVIRTRESFTVVPTRGDNYTMTAADKDSAKTWVKSIKKGIIKVEIEKKKRMTIMIKEQGWVDKLYIRERKVTRRYVLLDSYLLKYYDTDKIEKAQPRNTYILASAYVTKLSDYVFVVYTLDGNAIPFEAVSSQKCEEWITGIQSHISIADRIYRKNKLTKHGYLIKKGLERWFAIKDGVLYWLNNISCVEDVCKSRSNGYLELADTQIEAQLHNFSFTIKSTGKSDYTMICKNEIELNSWVSEIEKHQSNTSDIGLVFGSDLTDIVGRELCEVPSIVTTSCEFILQNGLVEGIFRISGDSRDIRELKDVFDTGDIPIFDPAKTDVHAVSGILKQFFRDLANPLIPEDIYEELLECDDVERISELFYDIPTPHFNSLKYLIQFLHELSSYSATTLMEANNLAIVFGPNILRRTGSEYYSSTYLETPLVLQTIRLIIEEYPAIFPHSDRDTF